MSRIALLSSSAISGCLRQRPKTKYTSMHQLIPCTSMHTRRHKWKFRTMCQKAAQHDPCQSNSKPASQEEAQHKVLELKNLSKVVRHRQRDLHSALCTAASCATLAYWYQPHAQKSRRRCCTPLRPSCGLLPQLAYCSSEQPPNKIEWDVAVGYKSWWATPLLDC